MIERHQDLSYYRGCRALLAQIESKFLRATCEQLIEEAEAEVMDAMAEAACKCPWDDDIRMGTVKDCPVHGGATK